MNARVTCLFSSPSRMEDYISVNGIATSEVWGTAFILLFGGGGGGGACWTHPAELTCALFCAILVMIVTSSRACWQVFSQTTPPPS